MLNCLFYCLFIHSLIISHQSWSGSQLIRSKPQKDWVHLENLTRMGDQGIAQLLLLIYF